MAVGVGKIFSIDRAVRELHAISTDPVVLGDVLGTYLARDDSPHGYDAAIALVRAAGADEDRAAAVAEWVRYRLRRDELGKFTDDLGADIPST